MSEVGHVTRLEWAGKEIFLVGTAHVSQKSVDEVIRVIEEVKPDTVCVELDEQRHRMLVDEDAWKKLDIFQVIRQQRVLFLMSSLALGAYQRKMGERLGVRPGAELLAAVKTAEKVGAHLVLADRDIQATLKRTWANLSFWDRVKITGGLVEAPFASEEIDEEKIEHLKDKDVIGGLLEELARELPRIKEPLIDERDAYLISSICDAPGKRIVGVVGAAHVKGMVERLGQPVDRARLMEIPPPSKLVQILKWIIPALLVLAFYQGFREHSGERLLDMVWAWILPTAVLCGVFTVFALGHPLTILSACLAAPLTTLHPAIGAGMVTGLVEAWIRKPTVEDCEQVSRSFTSLRAVYSNRVTRVLLVSILSSIGAALGAWVGASWVFWLSKSG
jgi:pheromone shutdown-related protein TraB